MTKTWFSIQAYEKQQLKETHSYPLDLGGAYNTFQENSRLLKNLRSKDFCLVDLEFSHKHSEVFHTIPILEQVSTEYFIYINN